MFREWVGVSIQQDCGSLFTVPLLDCDTAESEWIDQEEVRTTSDTVYDWKDKTNKTMRFCTRHRGNSPVTCSLLYRFRATRRSAEAALQSSVMCSLVFLLRPSCLCLVRGPRRRQVEKTTSKGDFVILARSQTLTRSNSTRDSPRQDIELSEVEQTRCESLSQGPVSRIGLERRAMTKAWFNELLRNEREWEDTTMASSDPNFCHRSERTRWNDSRW